MTTKKIRIIGIDAASKQSGTALALAEAVQSDGRWEVNLKEATAPSADATFYEIMGDWVADGVPNLVAIDAPLGWPDSMREALGSHRYGEIFGRPPGRDEEPPGSMRADDDEIRERSNYLFSRYSDRWIYEKIGKKPLDIGAAMIARAAAAILYRLHRCGYETRMPFQPDDLRPDNCLNLIEVYPAATLMALDKTLTRPSYKSGSGAEDQRRVIFERFRSEERFSVAQLDEDKVVTCDDIFDAVLCVMAAFDFLNGRTMAPTAEAFDGRQDWQELARREGWIWCRGL